MRGLGLVLKLYLNPTPLDPETVPKSKLVDETSAQTLIPETRNQKRQALRLKPESINPETAISKRHSACLMGPYTPNVETLRSVIEGFRFRVWGFCYARLRVAFAVVQQGLGM